jgi:hypothetical protein
MLFCLVWLGFFETGSCYIVKAGLELNMYPQADLKLAILLPQFLEC